MKKLLTIGVAVLLLALAGVGLVSCFWKDEEQAARAQIKRTFEVDVPTEAELAYYYHQDSFQDWTTYCAFTFENQPINWLEESGFSSEKDEDFEWSINEFLRWRTEGKKPTPQEYIPTFDGEYFWRQKGTHFLVYLPQKSMLVAYFVKM